MLISLSWKNIWRNKTRSLVVIGAVILGLTGGIFLLAFYMGMVNQHINDVIKYETAHIQIHNPEYVENEEIHHYIDNIEGITHSLNSNEQIRGVSPRTTITAMINSARASSGVTVLGIQPENEEKVTSIHEAIPDSIEVAKMFPDSSSYVKKYLEDSCGNFFKSDRRNQVVIGRKLAEKLKVHVRNTVTLQFQSVDGTLSGGGFKITGIYETNNSAFDETHVYVKKADIDRITGIEPNQAHEIVIALNDNNLTNEVTNSLNKEFPELTTRSWREIRPEVNLAIESMEAFNYIFIFIILLALGFGIVNTMLMVVLERIKELGMLMAVGMNRKRVFSLIMLETVFMALFGAIIGMGLSGLLISYFGNIGIDISMLSEGLQAMGYSPIVYPSLTMDYFINITLMVIGISILASVYPAVKALQTSPAEAIRTE